VPTVAERLWWVFWRLDARRSSNGYSANAISPTEIDAWCRVSGTRLKPWEIRALDEMEIIRLRCLGRNPEEEPEVVEGQPVTPALVKALFG